LAHIMDGEITLYCMFVFRRGHVRSARVLNAELKSEFDNVPRKPPGNEPRHASRIGLRIVLYLKFELNNLQVQPRRNQPRVDHRLVRDRRYLYRVTAADPFRCPPREPRWNAPRMKLRIEVGIELGIEQSTANPEKSTTRRPRIWRRPIRSSNRRHSHRDIPADHSFPPIATDPPSTSTATCRCRRERGGKEARDDGTDIFPRRECHWVGGRTCLGRARGVTRHGVGDGYLSPRAPATPWTRTTTSRTTNLPTPDLALAYWQEHKPLSGANTKKNDRNKQVNITSMARHKKRRGDPCDDFMTGKGAKWSNGGAVLDWERDAPAGREGGKVPWWSLKFMSKPESMSRGF
jgi:hypothetical protein